MPELVVVSFVDNVHRAAGVLDELRVLDDSWILDLANAIAVHRGADGAVEMDQSYQPTGRGATEWSGILGFLIGASLSIPFLTNASSMVAEGVITSAALARVGFAGTDASFWMQRFDIPYEFTSNVSQAVLPGNSAIFAMIDATDVTQISEQFQRYGGRIVPLSLSREQQRNIERLLADGDTLHKR
jgi:uncharacterized membrane protein